MDYVPRKGFIFSMYRDYPILRECKTKEDIALVMAQHHIPAAPVVPMVKKSTKNGCAKANTGTTALQLELPLVW